MSKDFVEWRISNLKDLGVFSRGVSKHRPRNDKKLFENGNYPFIQTSDVKNSTLYIENHNQSYNEFGLKQSKIWKEGTLCITIAANIAETAILKYPMCFPDSIVGFNSNIDKSHEVFVYYLIEYMKRHIQLVSSGSIQDNINIDYLTGLKLKVPNVEYQIKISNILRSIDEKILMNNKVNDNLATYSMVA